EEHFQYLYESYLLKKHIGLSSPEINYSITNKLKRATEHSSGDLQLLETLQELDKKIDVLPASSLLSDVLVNDPPTLH
ncbi:hypothetical protein, partial [Rickettsiales endosymbiont of Peranema trichophorum]|uniref:hypothetical protein n=1 Tax=Rickettsiales endosymbiont of Peranema trichophorum TaxID=2486577 RepID=UPI0013EE5C1E